MQQAFQAVADRLKQLWHPVAQGGWDLAPRVDAAPERPAQPGLPKNQHEDHRGDDRADRAADDLDRVRVIKEAPPRGG